MSSDADMVLRPGDDTASSSALSGPGDNEMAGETGLGSLDERWQNDPYGDPDWYYTPRILEGPLEEWQVRRQKNELAVYGRSYPYNGDWYYRPQILEGPLRPILKIYSMVLKVACPNLRNVTLFMHDLNGVAFAGPPAIWWHDKQQLDRRADEQILDDILQGFVSKLPSLRSLKLEGYVHEPTFTDPWGASVRWMGLVDKRPEWKPVTENFLQISKPRALQNGKGYHRRRTEHRNRMSTKMGKLVILANKASATVTDEVIEENTMEDGESLSYVTELA